jgi:hypothetical protein
MWNVAVPSIEFLAAWMALPRGFAEKPGAEEAAVSE